MRVTNSMLYRAGVFEAQAQRGRLAETQEKASTGREINRPSDDPVGTRAVVLLKDSLSATEQYERNLTRARSRISVSESVLDDSFEVAVRARELATQGRNETNDAVARRTMATEVEQLHDRLLSNANRRFQGAFIFAGYATDTQPFSSDAALNVTFNGTPDELGVDIDDGVSLQVTLNGQRTFLGDGDGDGNADPGRVNLFDTLRDLRDALVAGDMITVGRVIEDLDSAQDQISTERTTLGSEDTKATLWEERLSQQRSELLAQISLVEDADSIEVFSDLVRQEAALQASLEATARLLQPSLMDFL